MEYLESFLPQVKSVLRDCNLEVNESKTEFHSVYRAEPTAKDDSGQKLAGNEPCRSSKSLGSLLCTEKDIARRRTLAHAAFSIFKKVWLTGKKISLDRKLGLYNCNS